MTKGESPKMISVTMHDMLREDFVGWLDSRGLVLARFPEPMQDDPDMEGYFVTISPERAEQAFGRSSDGQG